MGRPQIVVLGMMTKIPVAGVVWQTLHYLVGFQRLGYETYYVEAHARTPSMLMQSPDDDSSALAAHFISSSLEPFGFGKRWAYHALHADGRCFGLTWEELSGLYGSAALIINLHGGTDPRPEHVATDRLVYLETDPVEVEVQLAGGRTETVDYLRPHCAYFTFGENYGRQDCKLPVSADFNFLPTRQPVVLDFWSDQGVIPGERYTTIGSWRQQWRDIHLDGETYGWSKHQEFLKFLQLPSRTGPRYELALAGCEGPDCQLLEQHGWRVLDAQPLSRDIDLYRRYISRSRAEFTVAKDQNIRLRTGWFSDRSATYLAAGRPVITQDTGFGNILPTGEGLFSFTDEDGIVAAVEAIEADYRRHSRAAVAIAQEYFAADRVLSALLKEVGLPRVPPSLVISPAGRRPTTLEPATVKMVTAAPLPVGLSDGSNLPKASVVVVTCNGLPFARLCAESVLGSLGAPELELIVVDNGSTDGTVAYLQRLAAHDRRVRVISIGRNMGFAAAVNQGLAAARGTFLVVLNHDTILPPRSLGRLLVRLDDPAVGLVGPVSNEAATEAEIDIEYHTYREMIAMSEARARAHREDVLDLPMLTMFCVALRREVYEAVGPLDESFELALFEDDDYSLRVRNSGLRVVCAEGVYVHHFGEAALGRLVPNGEHARLFETNRRRFENKWGIPWLEHGRRQSDDYRLTVDRVLEAVRDHVPAGARVLVISKGDDELVRLTGRVGAHFPQVGGGVYAGHHPADSREAINELERERLAGADYLVIPTTYMWWLDHYREFREYLDRSCPVVARRDDAGVIYALRSSA